MKFRPTEFLNTPYRVSCYIKLYRKLFSCMRPTSERSMEVTVKQLIPIVWAQIGGKWVLFGHSGAGRYME